MHSTSKLWTGSPRLLAEHLAPVPDPFDLALEPGTLAAPATVVARAARALLDLPEVEPEPPPWLAAHQVPALNRLRAISARYGGAVLADAVGLGKSYVALALAMEQHEPFTLVVPAVLVPQWKRLLNEKAADAEVITHEALSRLAFPAPGLVSPGRKPGATELRRSDHLVVVDEAHRFRNPATRRYRRLAELCIGARVILVTATPVHNRIADLVHLFRLFLRDDALTALGLGSLARAARGECEADVLRAVAARLIVARSRARASAARFPERAPGSVIRVGTAPPETMSCLVAHIQNLAIAGPAAALLKTVLLRRLASSVAAFRATLERYRAFVDLAADAGRAGRALGAPDFQRLFPRGDSADLQLALLPMLLESGDSAPTSTNLQRLDNLHRLARDACDPKARALDELLARSAGKTIVFTEARETARHLLRGLQHRHRVAAVTGAAGWFGDVRAPAHEVFASFAPLAQRAPLPRAALQTDVLIATDLASEGLNLQDAVRVVHYDLPWSPARLAQRVGRIDRLGSPHDRVSTTSFLPPLELARALRVERRLAGKLLDQLRAGAAQRETTVGSIAAPAPLDWCDRLQALATHAAPPGRWAVVAGAHDAAVLTVRIGEHAEAIVVEGGVARAAPERVTALLETARRADASTADRRPLDAALRVAAPLIRSRLTALQAARWRADDRDRLARRLIPWALTAARKAARSGDARLLGRLDQLVQRLTLGMTAGEEFALRALVERRTSLTVRDLLTWHQRLPAISGRPDAPSVELISAVRMVAPT
jgi:superfamily II DNA or RNA helicase